MRLFVSYRRDDTAGRAGRLFDGLVRQLGTRRVFQDLGSARPGVDFEGAIAAALARSDATLVVIGPQWLTMTDEAGARRLDQPADYVRREIAAALAAGGLVVPVLVAGADLPPVDALPDDLRELAQRQAVEISDETWHDDLRALLNHLKGETAVEPTRRRRRIVVAAVAAAALVVVVTIAVVTRRSNSGGSSSPTPPCPATDASWTSLPVAPDSSVLEEETGGLHHQIRFTVRGAQVGTRSGW